MKLFILLFYALAVALSCEAADADSYYLSGRQIKDATEKGNLVELMKTRHDAMKKEFMDNHLNNTSAFDDPRNVKRIYGGLQGIQESVNALHKEVIGMKSFKTEEEKAAYEDKMKENVTLTFESLDEDPKVVSLQITENPLEEAKQIVANVSLMNEDYKGNENDRQEDLRKRAEALFEQENGMTFDTYMDLLKEQAKSDTEQLIQPEKLGENVRFGKSSDVRIEKVNETTAIIRKNN